MLIVIAGAGEVGHNLARILSEHHSVFVIEKDDEKVEDLRNLNVEVIHGNAANIELLKSANVKKADVFLAVTGNDEVNLLSGIYAKRLGAKKVIVRVGNPEYVERPIVRDHPLGFDLVICPQLVLANEIANTIMIPGAVEFISLSGKSDMVEIAVRDSPIIGKRISELKIPRDVIILAILRDNEVLIPRGDTVIKKDDIVVVFGDAKEIARLKDIFGRPIVKNITIFGGGTVGSYVARILEFGNFDIKLIDSNISRCERLSEMLKKTKVVFGDATDLDFLIEEEVGKSDAVVATTESDEKNLLICLLSKSIGAKKAIAKVERGDYVRLFERVGVDITLSPRRVTFLEVMKYLGLVDIREMADIRQELTVVEVVVKNKEIAEKKISELRIPSNSIIGGIIRDDECIIPRGDTRILLNDRLLIFTNWDEIEEIEDIFEGD